MAGLEDLYRIGDTHLVVPGPAFDATIQAVVSAEQGNAPVYSAEASLLVLGVLAAREELTHPPSLGWGTVAQRIREQVPNRSDLSFAFLHGAGLTLELSELADSPLSRQGSDLMDRVLSRGKAQ